jgi:hypothetical protein
MNEPPIGDPLTQNWPDEPDRAEVEAFAQRMAAGLPGLAPESMNRIEQTINEAIGADARRRGRRRVFAVAGVAAGLLAAGGALWLSLSHRSVENQQPVTPETSEAVRDVYSISDALRPTPTVQDRPLITLDEYRSLFDH